jgi:AmmeMemoRadiSam system protein A
LHHIIVTFMAEPAVFEPIPGDSRRFLLRLARTTISAKLEGLPLPSDPPDAAALLQPRGAFVTLSLSGRLRGCIGNVEATTPLWRSVRQNALAAAFRDPRFPPLGAHELAAVRIEISALTPLLRCPPDEVEVGRDGILIECGSARGLLLPQVALEQGWNRDTLLDQTCRKAGLEPGCWRHAEAAVFRFAAEVFAEGVG